MRILFQGDSITDAGRDYNNDTNVGFGYPLLIKAALGYETPEKYEFINKGINGSRITNLCDRVKAYIHFIFLQKNIRRARKANFAFRNEACPAFFNKTFCPFRIGRFKHISLFVNNNNVFFDGCRPLCCKLSLLFVIMGVVPDLK